MIHRNEADPSARPDFKANPIVANTIPVNRLPSFHSE